LMQGASQIKLVGGGGVSSPRSPLDMSTFSEADLKAAIAVARDWNTIVTVHAYAPETVQRAVSAGARCIEHAHLMDETTAKMMADKGVWLSIQPFLSAEDTGTLTGPSHVASLQVFAGTNNAYQLAIKHKIKTAFGSDMLFSQAHAARQGTMLTHLTKWYSNADILKMATSTNAELLALSGPRNPYPGKLGVVEEGAFADLLLVDGNPLDDISLLANPDRSLLIVMKDGKIYKNTLPR
jgi:imidazolonepropionase-like amidohydrolase